MNRYICIHGHFYQPPRENPWLDEIETEDSAYPFHDWNERITAECYAPNASSRILQSKKKIIDIVNNYSKISFNFGPTLLSWIERKKPELYQSILEADKESQILFSGHGSALAQVYNHIIMPLANTRDKQTEVIWGIKDFYYRFCRSPEGMWLSETAVDYETLDILAKEGIKFTILAPHQASEVRDLNNGEWYECTQKTLDCTMPYLCRLPSGRTISLFFYNADISNELAFANLLDNGERFAKRMIHALPEKNDRSFLLTIATDGETYGHHHRFADMALAYAIYTIEKKNLANITNYGEYLEKFSPTHEIQIHENTSWSCSHGIERWRNDCGCRTLRDISNTHFDRYLEQSITPVFVGDVKKWTQNWRKPLREAINWLNTQLSVIFETEGSSLLNSPWDARNSYIELIIDKSAENIETFFLKHGIEELFPENRIRILKLLEMEKNCLFMNTSCGWFFDDITGIETIQIMRYACRAIQLAKDVSGIDVEPDFLQILQNASSNISELGDGSHIYNTYVKTAVIDIGRVAFHFAITSLIEDYPKEVRLYSYSISCKEYQRCTAGGLNLCCGYALFRSEITHEESLLMFSALHIRNHNFVGGVSPYTTPEEYDKMKQDLFISFSRSDIPGMIHCIDTHFVKHSYSIWQLFKDGKRKVLYSILNTTLLHIEAEYRNIYSQYFSLIGAMKEMQIKPPPALEFPMEYTLNQEIIRLLKNDSLDFIKLKSIVDAFIQGKFIPDIQMLQFVTVQTISRMMNLIKLYPENYGLFKDVNNLFSLLSPLSLTLDLWDSQNYYFTIGKTVYDTIYSRAKDGDDDAKIWIMEFNKLGNNLGVKCP